MIDFYTKTLNVPNKIHQDLSRIWLSLPLKLNWIEIEVML